MSQTGETIGTISWPHGRWVIRGFDERSGRQWRAKIRHFTCDITTQEFIEYTNFADTVVQDIARGLYESTFIPRNTLYDQASQNLVD